MQKTEHSELSLSERCTGYLRRLSEVAYEPSSDKKSKLDGQIASIDQLFEVSEGTATLEACESYAKVFEEILKSMYEVVDKLADEERCDDYGKQTLFEKKKGCWKYFFWGVETERLEHSDKFGFLAYTIKQRYGKIIDEYLDEPRFEVQIIPPSSKFDPSFRVKYYTDGFDKNPFSRDYIPLSLFTQMLLRYDTGEDKPEKSYDRRRIEKEQRFKSECAQDLMETVIKMYEILQSEVKKIITPVTPVQSELTYEI